MRWMRICSVACVCAFLFGTVWAADVTWMGGGTDTNWTTSGNWGGTAPTADDTAIVPTNETPFAVTVDDGAVAATLTATGATLTQGAGTATIGTSVTLNTGAAYTLSGGTLYTPSINVAGGTFTYGSGTLATDASTTGVTIDLTNGGTFVRNAIAGDSDAINNYTFTGDGTLRLRLTASDIRLTSTFTDFAGTIEVHNDNYSANTKLNTNRAGASTFASNGNITLDIMDQAQIFVATTPLACDTYIIGTGNRENRGAIRLGANVTGDVFLKGDATIGTEGGNISGAISSSATSGTQTLTVGTSNCGSNSTFSGVVSDGTTGGQLALKVARGILTLSNANNIYTGATTLSTIGSNSGVLRISSMNAISGTSKVVFDGGTLSVNATAGMLFSLTKPLEVTTGNALKLDIRNSNTSSAAWLAFTDDSSWGTAAAPVSFDIILSNTAGSASTNLGVLTFNTRDASGSIYDNYSGTIEIGSYTGVNIESADFFSHDNIAFKVNSGGRLQIRGNQKNLVQWNWQAAPWMCLAR
ncbi:MAG: hypothetical protein Q4D38_06345 [Planctomycetia bacterium]|nr:hypothetical protein [Planctomycetia bacterium]